MSVPFYGIGNVPESGRSVEEPVRLRAPLGEEAPRAAA